MANNMTITVDGTFSLGDAGIGAAVWKTIQAEKVAAYDGSLTFKLIKRGAALVTKKQAAPYVAEYLNGAVSDGAVHNVAITGDSIIAIDATGCEVWVTSAGRTVGSMLLEWEDSRA